MTIRTKTIEYAFPASNGAVAQANAGERIFTTIADLAIPESTSRTFRSVTLECACIDSNAAAASVTAITIGIGLASGSPQPGLSYNTVTFTLTSSGENQGFLFTRDVTSYFVSNYTGTTMVATATLSVTGTNVTTINANAKLIITYDFDDAAQTTRIKTVKIPIDGNTGNLTVSHANLGGVASQIPNLSTFLPESTKAYKSIFFQWDTHSGTSAAATSNLDVSYDGGSTTISDTSWGWTLNSDVAMRRIDDLTATLNTAASANLQARTISTTGSPCPCLCGVLVVTYTYDHSASSTILNSIQLPFEGESSWGATTATGDKSRAAVDFWVEEPASVALVQSAVMVTFNLSGSVTLDVRCGGQGARTYVHGASAHCGGMTSMRRIDSGESGGVAALTLARGENTLTVDAFGSSATAGNVPTLFAGIAYINYTSGKAAGGADTHNQTRHWLIQPYATGGAVVKLQITTAKTPIIQESDYYLSNAGFCGILSTLTTTPSPSAVAVFSETQSGEGEGAGWLPIFDGIYESDSEIGFCYLFSDFTLDVLRWPADWDTGRRVNIETARDWRFDALTTGVAVFQAAQLITYHTITFSITGNIAGSSTGSPTPVMTVNAYRTDTGEKVGSTSRIGDGSYTITVMDSAVAHFTETRDTQGGLFGRSDNGFPA